MKQEEVMKTRDDLLEVNIIARDDLFWVINRAASPYR